MSSGVSSKKQSFFKPINLQSDRESLFKSMLYAQCLLQLKKVGEPLENETDLTVVRASDWEGMTVTALYINGPKLTACDVTIVFDLVKSMYFCTGALKVTEFGKYVIEFKKLFELQRRDAYRVTIPENVIRARYHLSRVNGQDCPLELRVADLSAGGMGLVMNKDDAEAIAEGSRLEGSLKIGSHPPLPIKAMVRHRRKSVADTIIYYHVGCAFIEMTAAMNQTMSYLVNDCHRQAFARITK